MQRPHEIRVRCIEADADEPFKVGDIVSGQPSYSEARLFGISLNVEPDIYVWLDAREKFQSTSWASRFRIMTKRANIQ